jgi:hypothetical protein
MTFMTRRGSVDGTSMRQHAHAGGMFWLLWELGLYVVGVAIIIVAAAIIRLVWFIVK